MVCDSCCCCVIIISYVGTNYSQFYLGEFSKDACVKEIVEKYKKFTITDFNETTIFKYHDKTLNLQTSLKELTDENEIKIEAYTNCSTKKIGGSGGGSSGSGSVINKKKCLYLSFFTIVYFFSLYFFEYQNYEDS